jgi:tetratricopeptide (TPR) repeat protein
MALSSPDLDVEIQETRMSRLSLSQTEEICRASLKQVNLTPEHLAEIYEHTGGSPFLLSEFLSFYDAKDWSKKLARSLNEVVNARMLSLSSEEANLLDCVAAFPEEATFEPLKELSGLGDNELVAICERLHHKGLLYERAVGGTYAILFRYPLVKKGICDAMSGLKWWNLHKRLLEYYASHPEVPVGKRNLQIVAHHAGDRMAELKARVSELKSHFELNYELFPKLGDNELFGTSRTLTDAFLTQDYLNEAQELLDKLVRERGRTPELIACERAVLTVRGGYMRWNGDYATASGCLEEAGRIARTLPGRDGAVSEVLEQYCYLGIQKNDADLLASCAFKFYREARKANRRQSMGMVMRFIAILRIMEWNFEEASKLLGMSVRLFERLEAHGQGYTQSVVAAVHYHGDIALRAGDYEGALSHYLQCFKLCVGKGFYRGLGLHLAMAAWCAVRLSRMDEAREHLSYALPLLEGFQSRRGAGVCGGEIVFGLSALFGLWDGAPQKARQNLLYAEELSRIIQKPLWNAMLFCIKALLRESGLPMFNKILTSDSGRYLDRAADLLEKAGLPGEIEAFHQLRRYAKTSQAR